MPQARSHKAQYRIDNFYKLKETASQNTTEKKLELDIQGKRLGKKSWNSTMYLKASTGIVYSAISLINSSGEKNRYCRENGVGKSTFLNIITQNLQPDSGSISIGETVVYGYYKQSGIAFNETDRVIDIVKTLPNASIWATGELCPLLNSWNISCSPTNSNIPWSKS